MVWFGDGGNRQWTVMQAMAFAVIAFLLLVIWALAFARLPRSIRLWIVSGVAAVLLLAILTLRIRGVTGNLVPHFAWRWSTSEAGHIISATEAPGAKTSDTLQFLGPNRNAKIEDVELKDWTTHPPREIWRIGIGDGWSTLAVSGSQAITQEQRDEFECVVSYDILTGRQVWIHKDKTRYATPMGGIGPRATPTIRGNRVFTAGATGQLNCLDLTSGDLVWQRNFVEENDASVMQWGNPGPPLLLEEKVIINTGGRDNRNLVAYPAETGAFLWGGPVELVIAPHLYTMSQWLIRS
jgi:outer membrane protein assembly factor BamB